MLGKIAKMSVREAISVVAGPGGWSDNNDRMFERAALHCKTISARMLRSLWNEEIKNPDHWARREIIRHAEQVKAKQESRDLASKFETIAGNMNATDPDFYSSDVAALIRAARILRGLDRAGNSGEIADNQNEEMK